MNRIFAAGAALVIMSLPAAATGGFSCTIDDANLRLEAGAATGRGMGAPIIELTAKADIKLEGTPADFATLDLDKALVHHWLAYPDLRLHFYHERTGTQPHASVEIIIQTTSAASDEVSYEGQYSLEIFQAAPPAGMVTEDGMTKASGKVVCDGE